MLKEFLRSLPEPLLSGSVQEWLNAANSGRLEQLRRLLVQLPRENHLLLAHVICVLYHIAKRSTHNLMSAANLGKCIIFFIEFSVSLCFCSVGVCVGPSLLWESSQNAPMRTLPTLIEMLINNCQNLFGVQVVSLLGEVANDSGAEESDSLHCKQIFLKLIERLFY